MWRPGFNPQIEYSADSDGVPCLIYSEDGCSKTNQGGLRNKYCEPCVVYCYETDDWQRCSVCLVRKYIGLLPKGGKHSELYLQGKKKPIQNCWYNNMGLDMSMVSNMVKELCILAGIKVDRNDPKRNFRNQCLRSTSLTRLHQENIQEQVVKEISGHRSNAVHTYKVTPESVRCENCKIIQGQSAKKEILSTLSKAPESDHSDGDDFEASKMQICTSMKRNVEQMESSSSNFICNFIEQVSSKRKF